MAAPIPEEFKDLFTKKAFAHLATLMPDGSPQVTPVWCDYDGTYILINSGLTELRRWVRPRYFLVSNSGFVNPTSAISDRGRH